MQLVNINTTAVSSTQFEDYVASRVVDGNIDQYHTNCSHTNNINTIQVAWIYVDLGKVFSVKSVKFWYRNDGEDHIIFRVNYNTFTIHILMLFLQHLNSTYSYILIHLITKLQSQLGLLTPEQHVFVDTLSVCLKTVSHLQNQSRVTQIQEKAFRWPL